MGLTSDIEWTDATWNPWQGCTKISPACEHCYMFRDLARYGRDPSIVVRSKPPTFNLPLKRKGDGEFAIPDGSKVFTCSWSDWFHKAADEWRPEAWEIIRRRPDVTFQIVTKRAERIAECLPSDWGDGYPNVWLIVTAENQEWANKRITALLRTPAAVRGLSIEPLLGPIDLNRVYNSHQFNENALDHLDWVIVGGESGGGARPMNPVWVRELRDQCQGAGVPFFFKQWGEWLPLDHLPGQTPTDHTYGEFHSRHPESWIADCLCEEGTAAMFRVGNKAARRLLDGREWSEFPVSQFLPTH